MDRQRYIRSSGERKALPVETYDAIKRAILIYEDDARVAAYAAAPREGVTAGIVKSIRRRMRQKGEIPATAYSRRLEAKPVVAQPARSWRDPLAGSSGVD